MKLFFLLLFFSLFTIIQIRKLYAKKKIREIYVFSFLMLIATYLSAGQLLELYIPNPTNGIRLIFEPIQTWFLSLLS